MSYRKAYERLLAFEPKALGLGMYYDEECGAYCAIGALAPERAARLGIVQLNRVGLSHSRVRSLLHEDLEALGLTFEEAIELQATNDAFIGSAASRYEHVLAWLETRVKREEEAHELPESL